MAAVCPAGLLLTHIMPLCKSEAGAPSVGQTRPWAGGAELESVLSPSAGQPHVAARSPRELSHSIGPSLTLQELVRLMRFQQKHESRMTV